MLVDTMRGNRRVVMIVATLVLGTAVGCPRSDERAGPQATPSTATAAQTPAAAEEPTTPQPATGNVSTASPTRPDAAGQTTAARRKRLSPEDQRRAAEVEAAISRVIPADVREKRREPTDRERLAL